jgi:hypothetical protein
MPPKIMPPKRPLPRGKASCSQDRAGVEYHKTARSGSSDRRGPLAKSPNIIAHSVLATTLGLGQMVQRESRVATTERAERATV